MHMSAGAYRSQKSLSNPPALGGCELSDVGTGTELNSSAKLVVSAPNC